MNFNKLSAYFLGKLPNSVKIDVPIFIEILKNEVKIDEEFFNEYLHNSWTREKDFLSLFKRIEDTTNGNNKINEILRYFNLPGNFVKEIDFSKSIEDSLETKDFQKIIGFITPFDERQGKVQEIVSSIVKSIGWDIKQGNMNDDGHGSFLWDSVKEFLEKYPLYIVDLRKKQGSNETSINVALELGYILAKKKSCIVLTDDKLPSDIIGFKYIKPEKIEYIAGDSNSNLDTSKIDEKFKNELEDAIKTKLNDLNLLQ